MAHHTITLIPGDGIGPEVTTAARRAIEATDVDVTWEVVNAGAAVMEQTGEALPTNLLESIRRNRVALKGPVTTPVSTGMRSVNVALRQALDLFALVRPCTTYPGVRSPFTNIDLVIVRENTEDLYAGIEFAEGTDDCRAIIDTIEGHGGKSIPRDSGLSIKPISIRATQRIFRFAFEWARLHRRRMVTAVHKANIMKYTDGLWLGVAREVATHFPDIEFNDRIVDNMAMQLVQKPELYDVLVMPNMYGDILSDLCAGLIGGLGLAPGANIGDEVAVFEATHGSAPRHAGRNIANPMAMMFTGAMMLRHIGEIHAATQLEAAVAAVIAEGKHVTYDLKQHRDDPSAAGTSDVADAVIAELKRETMLSP